jgi:hypothetical protein
MENAITPPGGTDYLISLDHFEYKLLKDAIFHLIEMDKINEQSGYRKGGFSSVEDLADLMYKIESAERVDRAGGFRTLHEWEDYLAATEEAEEHLTSFMTEMYAKNPQLPREEATPRDVYAPGKKIRQTLEELKAEGLSDEEIADELNRLYLGNLESRGTVEE